MGRGFYVDFFSVLEGALLSSHNVLGPHQAGPEFRTGLRSQERGEVLNTSTT